MGHSVLQPPISESLSVSLGSHILSTVSYHCKDFKCEIAWEQIAEKLCHAFTYPESFAKKFKCGVYVHRPDEETVRACYYD